MQIVVLTSPETEIEFRQKFPAPLDYTVVHTYYSLLPLLDNANVIFDFYLASEPQKGYLYANRSSLVVFCEATKIQLAAHFSSLSCSMFGFNGLPSFINRQILEVSLLNQESTLLLESICAYLNTEYLLVADRIGMVTPRIIAMVINEAYYTLQERTATVTDINISMQLGTNYPYGPFEWVSLIGIQHIVELLTFIYNDTKDERYKICPLLKTKYLRGDSF